MRGAGRGVKIMREKTMSRSVEELVYLEGDHVLKLIEYGRAPRLPTLELRNDSHIGYISFSFRTCKKKKQLNTYIHMYSISTTASFAATSHTQSPTSINVLPNTPNPAKTLSQSHFVDSLVSGLCG